MSGIMKCCAASLCLVLAGAICATRAPADEYSQTTKLTFKAPVEVPGVVLLPGTYEFRMFDTQSALNCVEILDADGMHVIAIVNTIPATRPEPGKTEVTFQQRSPDSPEAIKDWFYAGRMTGHEFLYSPARHVDSTMALARK